MRRYVDPEAYRIIVFDQRGTGKSRPSAELKVLDYICGILVFIYY
jgi:pimeloyl-ACP methyl ester carboxylesterase